MSQTLSSSVRSPIKTMSERYWDFERLVEFLEQHKGVFNAPYGILPGSQPGKYAGSVICYTVTFGCARTMDATAYVFSPSRVGLTTRGYYDHLQGDYKTVDALIKALTDEFLQPF
jgi:hypothetical protein